MGTIIVGAFFLILAIGAFLYLCQNNSIESEDSEVKDLLNLLTADTARRLSYDRNIVEKTK